MRDYKKMAEDERRHRLDEIVKGSDSEYWNILTEEIMSMIEKEERFQDGFKRGGDIRALAGEYIRSRDQVYFLRNFLGINDILISKHQTLSEKAKDFVNEIFERSTSFVGKIKEEGNG